MTDNYDWSQHRADISHLRDATVTDEHGAYNFEKASEEVEKAFRHQRASTRSPQQPNSPKS
ncbi:MAG: hypothetical protein OXH08_16970 [Gammaproteobacteria bacterium]|nr:hypothetical protein [Gammaproteobacteria bacterium]